MIIINLDNLLKEKNISQRELSRRTGIRQPTISEMCLNKTKSIPLTNLYLICIELDCDIADILKLEKEQSE
ncbi:helix-turn-helix transcriptional regulator [Mesobacillus subterraneus]|uniref:helix-turn-helix domain-containing protein n=1 Tax=Mesobacillus subterraneus TaxID=285983 RepID=UPI00203AA8E0|nr:helix-turn-helix transcriptional regulator [Mesobacillus subterraneus]MCM3573272.1 helix-turn-helix transcriptional regulator [Mesobacillus subterraneus]